MEPESGFRAGGAKHQLSGSGKASLEWNRSRIWILRKEFRGGVPDPGCTFTQYRASWRFGEASPRAFSKHTLCEVGSFESGVQRGLSMAAE